MKKKIAVLGATGSVGTTALKIIEDNLVDFEVVLLANNSNLTALKNLQQKFLPRIAICVEKDYYYNQGKVYKYDKDYLSLPQIYNDCDIVINGISGISGLLPSIAVMKAGKTLASANKESFVVAGSLMNKVKKEYDATIIPIDSEHSAIWQLIVNEEKSNVKSIILTASGGAFRDWAYKNLKDATAEEALHHPTWKMGKKITIDCATLMNKGMEIIEAKHLFGVDDIQVVGHRQSIVHAMVQYKDNYISASLSYPDMTLPIQLALYYPKRTKNNVPMLDFAELGELTFNKIDEEKFPCLKIAKKVWQMGDVAGTIMNSANEVATQAYLQNKIGFYDIPRLIQRALDCFAVNGDFENLNEVFCMDQRVSEYTLKGIYGGR